MAIISKLSKPVTNIGCTHKKVDCIRKAVDVRSPKKEEEFQWEAEVEIRTYKNANIHLSKQNLWKQILMILYKN